MALTGYPTCQDFARRIELKSGRDWGYSVTAIPTTSTSSAMVAVDALEYLELSRDYEK